MTIYDYLQLDRNVESAIEYRKIVDDTSLTREMKTDLILKKIDEDSKLSTLDNPIKRFNRIKDEIKNMLKNKQYEV